MHRTKTSGLTFIEVIAVTAIMLIIVTFAIVGFRNFATYQMYEQEVVAAKSALVEVRVRARSAVGEEVHGIKFLGNSMVLFSGATYSGTDPNNEVIDLDVITLIPDLTGGTDEIIFSQLTGVPSATGTVDVVGVDFEATTTLEVTAAGVIQ